MIIRPQTNWDKDKIERIVNIDSEAILFLGEMAYYVHEHTPNYWKRVMIAESDGEVVWFIAMQSYSYAKQIEIKSLFVDKNHRWKWIGSALLSEAEKMAKLFWEKIITLKVYSNNIGWINFYEKNYFKNTGTFLYHTFINWENVSIHQYTKLL